MDITFLNEVPSNLQEYSIIVDALFGFGYKPPAREEFIPLLERLSVLDNRVNKLVCVDIPSGWNVETGPISGTPALNPDCLISLTAPKMCAKNFTGKHWIGGRFVPDCLSRKYGLDLPKYPNEDQCVQII